MLIIVFLNLLCLVFSVPFIDFSFLLFSNSFCLFPLLENALALYHIPSNEVFILVIKFLGFMNYFLLSSFFLLSLIYSSLFLFHGYIISTYLSDDIQYSYLELFFFILVIAFIGKIFFNIFHVYLCFGDMLLRIVLLYMMIKFICEII